MEAGLAKSMEDWWGVTFFNSPPKSLHSAGNPAAPEEELFFSLFCHSFARNSSGSGMRRCVKRSPSMKYYHLMGLQLHEEEDNV
jgi:hypothetical protein